VTDPRTPLRIAYSTGQYPRATDRFIQREVAALRRRGCVIVTFAARRGAETAPADDGVRTEAAATTYLSEQPLTAVAGAITGLCLRTPGRFWRSLRLAIATRSPGLRSLVDQLLYFVEACVLVRSMRQQGLVHLHNHFADSSCTIAMLAAELGGFTFSFALHGPAVFFEASRWRLDEKLRRAEFVACISHFARSQGMLFCRPPVWARLHVVHCGVDPSAYEVRRHVGRGCRLLFTGRLAPQKGLPILLEAVALLRPAHPDLRLDLVGDGPEASLLRAEVQRRDLSGHVVFHGYRSEAEVARCLQASDVFVMSSFAEGLPVVLVEALASGVPVIAPRIAAIPELVEDDVTGLLVAPGDPLALADALDRLLCDAALRRRLGGAGRRRIEQDFDSDKEAAWLGQLLDAARTGLPMPVRATAARAQQ
jgi:glycosyltransferase involved in cell wall biosynthesis